LPAAPASRDRRKEKTMYDKDKLDELLRFAAVPR
jgi:hypothetical protein